MSRAARLGKHYEKGLKDNSSLLLWLFLRPGIIFRLDSRCGGNQDLLFPIKMEKGQRWFMPFFRVET